MSYPDNSFQISKKKYRHGLMIIIFLYLGLSFIYLLSTPPFEASDEYKHYPVVQYIQTELELPVLDPENPGLWLQEAAQPPLYYLLMAAITAAIDTADLGDVHQVNPHAFVGNPNQIANKNLVIHDAEEEAFPWKGSILAVYVIRLASILLGAGTIFIAAQLGSLLFNSIVGLLAAALTAFNPMFIFVNAAVNNDSLAILLGSLATLMLVRLWRDRPDPRHAWARYALLGLVIGLGILTKLSLGGLLVLAAVAVGWQSWRERKASILLGGAIILAITLLVTIPWFINNITLYGDPFGLSAFIEVQGTRESPITISGWQAEFGTFYRSYWGLFGGVNIAAPEIYYILFNILAIIGAGGLVIWLWRQRTNILFHFRNRENLPEESAAEGSVEDIGNRLPATNDYRGIWFLFAWPAILFLLLIRWNMISPSFQGRLLFPAIASINVLWSIGLLAWVKQSNRLRLATALSVLTLAGALLLPWLVIRPAYALPQPLTEVPDEARFGPITFSAGEDELLLIGVELPPEQSVAPGGDPIQLILYWQASGPISQDYLTSIHLLGRSNESIGQVNRFPASGMVLPTQWQTGQIWRDEYTVIVKKDADAPSRLRVHVAVFDSGKNSDLSAVGPDGKPIDLLIVGEARLENTDLSAMQPDIIVNNDLSEGISLWGYDIIPDSPQAGDQLLLSLYWQVNTAPSKEYTVFLHLLDNQGNPVVVADGPPVGGDYPTYLWQPGDRVKDEHLLNVPASLPAGEYYLSIGLYDSGTLQRVPLANGTGDAITLPISIGDDS